MKFHPLIRSAHFINKADRDRETFASQQVKRMMGTGNPMTGKDNRSAGSTLCPTCGDQHRLGTTCAEITKADAPTMPGKKAGTPHVTPHAGSGNPFHDPGSGKFAPQSSGVSGSALKQPELQGHQGGGPGGIPTAPGMAQQATGQYAKPGQGPAPVNVGPPPAVLHSNDPAVVAAHKQSDPLPHNWPPRDAQMTQMAGTPGGAAPQGMNSPPVAHMSDEERNKMLSDAMAKFAQMPGTVQPGHPMASMQGSPQMTMQPTSAGRAVPGMASTPPPQMPHQNTTMMSAPSGQPGMPAQTSAPQAAHQNPTMMGAPPAQPGMHQPSAPHTAPQAPQMPHASPAPQMAPAAPVAPPATPPPGQNAAPPGAPKAQGTGSNEQLKLPINTAFSQGENIGAGLDRPGGSARPTANMAAGRAHQMLNWRPPAGPKAPQAQKSLLEIWLDKHL